ncbi:MAG: hypothetical protein WCX22_12895 [Methanoregula sp.]
MTSLFFKKIAAIVILLIILIAVCAYALTIPTAPQQSIPERWVEEMRDQP